MQIPFAIEEIQRLSRFSHQSILGHYVYNRLAAEISNPPNVRRLRRQGPSDLPQPADDEDLNHHHSPTGPVRISSVDDFSTQDTYLEQIYLLLHIIESIL
jgi:hypothetical protein